MREEKERHDVFNYKKIRCPANTTRGLCPKEMRKAVPLGTSMTIRGKLPRGKTLFRKDTTNAVPKRYAFP